MIPKDHQGAESDAKAKNRCKSKEPLFLFELARAQSPTCTDEAVRYRRERESGFQKHKGFIGIMALADWLGKGRGLGRLAAKVRSQISNYQHHLELVKNANVGPGGHRPTESDTLGVGLSNLCLNKSSRRF